MTGLAWGGATGGQMMGGNIFLIMGLVAVLGVAVNFMRLWSFVSGGNRAKISRIADSDAHLSFDERIAERLRELEKERSAGLPSTPAPTQGFGRRQV